MTRGDFSAYLKEVVSHLQAAITFAANESQKAMLEAYVAHFQTGDIDAHLKSQRHWVDDKGPVVETQLGFIEAYRDPAGLHAHLRC